MRLSTVILPIHRWSEGQKIWQRAEELGFHAAYTYDHLSWGSFRDGTWFGAIPTLTAAATATERIRLGTLVASPNFRHPVTLAKELLTLDDISGGRLTAGIGAGGPGFDTTVLGQEAWSATERADRFAEFVALLDRLLTQDATTEQRHHYTAAEARNIPGCIQRPRVPFHIAATGPRGLRVAARHAQGWVTCGDPADPDVPAERASAVIATQLARLHTACESEGRTPDSLAKVLVQGFTAERPLTSLDAFVHWAGTYRELGMTELVLHWPVPDSVFANDLTVFERIATEGLAQLG
ncbi:LLM class flavin-dependent oxidoreductase [Kitasatospora sp. MAP5-34]|uniref:LLM class flavin-dependent oxidoreductase n=1 Tax=Kitasatospora sp. MAP5-34 TaxID=3035102 RepID=UPI0024733118|nr:LLM class flavin-dependent oxidoreductase [Kitasatospora sp. MAP5-34]MDH6576805.1 alkanesulfonate monooxygenase SsuD/methylene tetrahydromethanopterin reductase-like flavin-dependent oxidoreductase (luciferase family) [Kitasatospora sp. MAP5-34]